MTERKGRTLVRRLAIPASAVSLAVCLIAPVLYLLGRIGDGSYKGLLLAGSIGWFLCAAALSATHSTKPREP